MRASPYLQLHLMMGQQGDVAATHVAWCSLPPPHPSALLAPLWLQRCGSYYSTFLATAAPSVPSLLPPWPARSSAFWAQWRCTCTC